MEVGYQRTPGNPQVEHPVLHATGEADSVALGPAGEAAQSAWPLIRPDSTVVVVAAEIHYHSHGQSLQAFHKFDQPFVIMEDIH